MPWLLRFDLWPYYLGRAVWRVGAENQRRVPQARALPAKSEDSP